MARRLYIQTKTKTEAYQLATWSDMIVDHEGGYLAFEEIEDYRAWMREEEDLFLTHSKEIK